MKKNKRVLLADLGKTDVVQDIPYLCKGAGCEVVVLCPRSSWLLKNTQWDTWIEAIDKEVYIQKLRELVESNSYDWVLLADEGSLTFVNDCSDEDAILSSTLPISNKDHRTMLGSKAGLYKVCTERGITMPKSMLYDERQNLEQVMDTWNFPVLTKVDRSAGGRGVTYCRDVSQLVEVIENTPKDKKDGLVIQEYIQGDNISVEALYKDGHLLAYASSKVLKSWNGEFSESCVRSYFFDPALEVILQNIGRTVGIRGFASMTFMRKDESYFLFECDLRAQVWFRHACFVGVDFSEAIMNFLSGNTELIRPNIKKGEEKLLKFFPRDILRCVQEGDIRGLMSWCANREGDWKFIPFHDRKILLATFIHIGSKSLKLMYNKPKFSLIRKYYRLLKGIKT